MQILLRLVAWNCFDIVDGQCLNYRLKRPHILDRIQRIVETPDNYWQHNGLDSDQRAKIDAILHKTNEAAISADQTVPRGERSFAICTRPATFKKAVKEHNTCRDSDDEADYTDVSDDTANDADIVLWEM